MAKRYRADSDYRIGRSPTELLKLRDLHVGPPDQVIFQPAAAYYVRGDLARVGDGYTTILWVWDIISNIGLSKLLEFLDGEDYADLYIFTDRRDGRNSKPSQAFGLYSVRMWWPLMFGQEGTPVVRSPYASQTVQLQFKKAVFVASYPL